ncbi:MAG TPA: galactokinase [Thermotogae bacterium]|nr:galactokinase [Thermotogota bacterium]HCZ07523.1 galactokinase [Thermotogota bacterium]
MPLRNSGRLNALVEIVSPGRVNIIGEHTDYNDGFVLPFAIDKHVTARIEPSERWEFYSENFEEQVVLDEIKKTSTWADYALGVIDILRSRFDIPPLRVEISSNLPAGAGFSSSAALELAVGWGIKELFDLPITRVEMVHVCHRAENEFVGMRCGVMDQFSVALSKKGYAIFLDTSSLEYRYVPLNMIGTSFYVIDSNVRRSLVDSEYNRRRKECEEVLRILGKKSFREIKLEELSKLPEILQKRARHVLEENQRVTDAVDALEKGNMKRLGELLYSSHESLRDMYEVSCSQIDYIVEWLKRVPSVLGARIFGGGFGGGVLVLSTDPLDEFFPQLAKEYESRFGLPLSLMKISSDDGVRRLA